MIVTYKNKSPEIAKDVFIAENVTVVGDVAIGENSSVWFGAVIRGDSNSIKIGSRTNIQDLCVVHVDSSNKVEVGDNVTIGHRAIIHGCKIGSNCLIGMGSIIMSGAQIGDDCIVGAGALVTEGQVIPPKSLVLGMPGKPKRSLTDSELMEIKKAAEHYLKKGREYLKG
ncbi:MAG: gamma carbonic anhydrase family protein [Deltaproteobacteria bacterium]|nr:gamma carbonic anhydrase family protein [Deltaproteobacteria bacterium]MBI2341843.1 gamma carbonic anhydrase family protein [Deltaproteobacteria bacterium]